MTATWTYNQDGSYQIAYADVAGRSYSGDVVTRNADGAIRDIDYSGVPGQTYSSYDVVYGANGKPASASYNDGMTATWTYNQDGSYQIDYADVAGESYSGDIVTRNANGTVHDVAYSGVTGLAYSSYDVVYGANAKPASASYNNGMTAAWSYNQDGSYQIAFTGGAGASYTTMICDYDSSGHLATSLTAYTNGTYALVGHQNSLTLTATAGPETLRGGDDQTFVFSTPFGHDTLSDFASTLSGSAPDVLSVPGAAFGDSFAQLLMDTTFTNAGATITLDSADTIYAPGLTKSLMVASQQDFVFH